MIFKALEQAHLRDAAELFAAAYRRQREEVPILDASFCNAETVLPKLEPFLEKGQGIAVFSNDKMAGFMLGVQIDNFLSPNRGVYIPEWAHASIDENTFDIYRIMYREMGRQWVADGCLTHAINFLECAKDAQESFVWSGFGGICFDAVRPVEKMGAEMPKGVHISPMEEKDVPEWLPMVEASSRHLAASPSFIPHLDSANPDDLRKMLKQPGNAAWMARLNGEPVGYMKVTPVGDGAAWVVNGERKFAVNGAYVMPEFRGKGIARSLLSAIMDWGAVNGFERCSVDFEATNPEACHFWLKHLKPVCRSFVRRLDSRILKSNQ